jgi:aminoglycoside phosphotransferase (APT) family kinase protein
VQLLAEGREAEVFLQDDGTVLKLMRDPAWGERVHREASALRALTAAGVAAPAVYGVVVVDGRPGLVSERIDGVDLIARMARNPLIVDRVAAALARAHVAMHQVVAPGSLPDLKAEQRVRIERADPLPSEMRGPILTVLDALPPGDRLCHGDLHPGNMLGELRAPVVIDWGDASRGDPMADMVRTSLLLRVGVPPPGAPRLIQLLAPVGRGILSRRYVAHYRRLRPIDMTLLARWRLVRAAARLAEGIEEENPALLRIVRRDLAALDR